MHSCETQPAPAPPATGPSLLLELGRLIIRARGISPPARAPAPRDRLHAKLLQANPSTSQQIQQSQPKPASDPPALEATLSDHVDALWKDHTPICIEVLLAPDCPECYSSISSHASFDKHAPKALLLERWTIRPQQHKATSAPASITSQWLLNAVRSQLHFSQLSAWIATLKQSQGDAPRRRKLSRETCNFKKISGNCEESEERKLNIVYWLRAAARCAPAEFANTPTNHNFPVTDIGNNVYLKVLLESLPRIDEIPTLKCSCAPKRRASKELAAPAHDELANILNDLTISPNYTEEKRIVDDRMYTTCSENGKHKCNCDDESEDNPRTSSNLSQETKKLDERRLKEIAKYKRRLRKESKLKKMCDSTSSEGELKAKETHTSIPILQAARFDRFRAIGCYRNQTYLTLPASRIESKSPFVETDSIPPAEFKKTNTIGTQTDDCCQCGCPLQIFCDGCNDKERKMVRSEANYNLASLNPSEVLLDAINRCSENGARRKCEEDDNVFKKHKCDNSVNLKCDKNSDSNLIKRPKLGRFMPVVDRIEKVVNDRCRKTEMELLHLDKDDSVFSVAKPDVKRQKTYSISEDYVCYEKCDYGTFDRCDMDSPSDEGFKFPDPKKGQDQVPSPTEVDRFRWRFDSAASMVFHTKTGLPLTSSPAPLRRGNNCFDFDDSINGISGIKSALFHPAPPAAAAAPASPASPPPAAPPAAPPPAARREDTPKLRIGPSAGLLGTFEESALKGRLEPAATVHGFTAELGASGAFCPPHKRLPVTVFFYAPGGTNAPYMGHINLGPTGYRVARSGTIQVSLFNPHGTLVKMFVVLYELTTMPPLARTFLRQRTLYMPAGADPPSPQEIHKWLRYLIHLRFMTSKSGKLYLHTDIRILVSRKADLDTATAHSALFRPIPTNQKPSDSKTTNQKQEENPPTNQSEASEIPTNGSDYTKHESTNWSGEEKKMVVRSPNRVFGGCSDFSSEMREIGYDNQNGVSYELRSFTYAPENPRYSPR